MAVNGVYIVLGEANTVVALLNKARRQYQLSHQPPSLEDTDPLLRNFTDLKEVLNAVADLADMNPLMYLSPFLDVIKAQNTNGPITEAALSSVAKFLSYGLIDASSIKASNAVESIAYAVVHTKFIGGKSSGSDECVLYKILHVLRSLLLSPPGSLLSNEAVCDLMQSCFRIVFEQHLSPLLRKAAESTLSDMTQLIFTRLPTFREDTRHPYIRKLVMNSKGEKKKRRRRAQENAVEDSDQEEDDVEMVTAPPREDDALLGSAEVSSRDDRKDSSDANADTATKMAGYDIVLTTDPACDVVTSCDRQLDDKREEAKKEEEEKADDADSEGDDSAQARATAHKEEPMLRHVNLQRGADDAVMNSPSTVQMPYGLPCCRELLRFLIALTNPLDRQNTEAMVVLGLNLITVALEAAADHLSSYSFLLPLIKDNLCRSLLQLLDTEKLPVLAATNRACFLLFESMRSQLKFQLESYFHKLRSIVLSEQRTTSYEQKEMALESLVQLWRIPGLVTELYLNYDCDLYCSNVFEELTKLLVDMSFPVAGLRPASLLSLDALLVVIDTIDQNCVCRQAGAPMPHSITDSRATGQMLELPILSGYEIGKKIMAASESESSPERDVYSESALPTVMLRANRHAPSDQMPSMSDVIDQKKRKRIFAEGTEMFNKSPKKGIEFLREKGLLGDDAQNVVHWLRSNPQLDKKMIADYICNRKHAEVLEAFVRSFPFENTRLDDSLRMFLETFRLPGEAAEISMVMQQFSEHWYQANNEPFNHVDAAFTLSYAVIMLNMDQHNPQVKRAQPPMTVDCFKRNLSGTNGGEDLDPDMLVAIYNAIKSEEIVMPAEQTGLVKENYMWKVLLRRGETTEGSFAHAPTGWNDHDLFALAWGPAIAALSYVFDKTEHDVILKRALNGYRKCASISAHYGMKDVFDNLVIHLCKFSTLTAVTEVGSDETPEMTRQRGLGETSLSVPSEAVALAFGENHKAQEATRVLFELVHQNGDILREGWRNMMDVLLYLFRARLLPADLTEVDDFVDEKGWVSIVRNHVKEANPARNDTGLLSWFGLGGGASETDRKKPTTEQQNTIKLAGGVITECRPSQLVTDSKYLTSSALTELLTALTGASGAVLEQNNDRKPAASLSGENEDALVFYLELMISITLENKDRLAIVWPTVKRHLEWLLSSRFGRCPVLVERAVVGLLRVANRNLFRDNTVADDVLQSLSLLLRLSPKAMFVFSRQIAFGLHELLRNNAANVHRKEHWQVLFALMEAAGAALLPEDNQPVVADRNAVSDGENATLRPTTDDRGYTSDNPQDRRAPYSSGNMSSADSAVSLDRSREWIHLDHKDAARATQDALRALGDSRSAFQRGSLVLTTNLGRHEPAAFLKVCECLAFLLRDAAHVTPDNFESSVQCLRTMVEASLDGGRYAAGPLSGDAQNRLRSNVDDRSPKRNKQVTKSGKKELSTDVYEEDDLRKEEQQLSASYQQVSIQLLDLSSTLHNLAPGILAKWAVANPDANVDVSVAALWQSVWRPLLQAIARLGCDCRRFVRSSALTHLQRAFLPSNMADLGPAEWESCFGEVLFPLLTKLLEPFSAMDPIGMEDTRVRAIQIVAKTLLNHLTPLSSLTSFPGLWLRLLDSMEQYLRVDSCGNLNEAVPESLKNMLLVLDNTGLFTSIPGLHHMTVTKMGPVLPQLIRDTLPNPPPAVAAPAQSPTDPTSLASLSASARGSRVQLAPAIPVAEQDIATAPQPTSPTQSASSSQHSTPAHVPHPPTAPVEIPELTEVVVHSGAASPISLIAQSPVDHVAGSAMSSSSQTSIGDFTSPHPQQQQPQPTASASANVEHVQPTLSHSYEAPAAPQQQPYYQQTYDQQQYAQYYHQQQQHLQQQQYYQHQQAMYAQSTQQHQQQAQAQSYGSPSHQAHQPSAQSPTHQQPQQPYTVVPTPQYAQPIHATNYTHQSYQQQPYDHQHQQQQQYMPQADLAKVFATTQVPQFVPPAELLQSVYNQHSVANPLPLPHTAVSLLSAPLAPSANSAFSQVSHEQPSTHQSPYHFAPIQSSPPQERP